MGKHTDENFAGTIIADVSGIRKARLWTPGMNEVEYWNGRYWCYQIGPYEWRGHKGGAIMQIWQNYVNWVIGLGMMVNNGYPVFSGGLWEPPSGTINDVPAESFWFDGLCYTYWENDIKTVQAAVGAETPGKNFFEGMNFVQPLKTYRFANQADHTRIYIRKGET